MKKGDIVLIPFPFTDLLGSKNRPALVLVSTLEDVTVSFLTTQLKWKEKYDIIINPSAKNGLKKESLLRLHKLATLNKNLAIGRIGDLEETHLKTLNRNLIALFQLK